MRAHGERQTCLGHGQVDGGSRFHRLEISSARAPILSLSSVEDAVDLVLFVELALPPAVVQFDDFERLDEERLTACRRVVDDPLQLSPGVRTHRHHVATIPCGDN